MLHGQRDKRRAAAPLMRLYEREEQRWSAPGNTGSVSRSRLGCCPCWLRSTVPLMSPADPRGHFPRYTLSLASVYNLTLIPMNLLLVPGGWRAGRGGLALGRAKTFSHATRKPRLTDRPGPGLLFTLSRCGLPLVFLSNYPSLTESMCQSKSLRVRAARARAPRAAQPERPAASPVPLTP